MTRSVRTALLLATAALTLAGCGNRHEIQTQAETEGIYLDAGALDYQVQISRQLNPAIVPDRSYLLGLPEYVSPLEDDETWFAIFLRVANQTDEPHESAEEFAITDTLGKDYRPIEIKPEDNPLAYAATVLPPGGVLPSTDSVPSVDPAQGALLLFKIPVSSLENRPLIFKIESPEGEAEVDLDV